MVGFLEVICCKATSEVGSFSSSLPSRTLSELGGIKPFGLKLVTVDESPFLR